MSKEPAAVIRLHDVSKRFGSFTALDDISFSVRKGEVVGFVGANGAGKTTTISTILGFISPSVGEVALFGQAVTPPSAHKLHGRIGYAAGDMGLPLRLSGRQYLGFVAAQSKRDTAARLGELEKLFQPELEKKIGALSRGNRQKIALIAAFLTSPELVVLDEPTSGLDPVMQEKFIELVRREAAGGTTIFMSSHYLNEIADVCSRVILMRHGKIITDTPVEQLLKKSGKQVRVVSGYGRTLAPSGASEVERSVADGRVSLAFNWQENPAKLQQWLASVKQLQDIEVTEFNLEAAFKGMYDDEEKRT